MVSANKNSRVHRTRSVRDRKDKIRCLYTGGGARKLKPGVAWGPPSLPYYAYRLTFQGVKRPEHGADHPPPSSAEVKERVELYFYSPSGPSWPVLG